MAKKGKKSVKVDSDEVLASLKKIAGANDIKDDVIVGFSASYAIYVHEDLNAYHRVGQAKYLEKPARDLRNQLLMIMASVYKKTGNLLSGMLIAGLRLQREAQKLTPVDTGFLKNSAFTRKERKK